MTDTTHEAPERIWATMMDPECARSGTFVDLKEYPTKPNHDAIEYVRADLVKERSDEVQAAEPRGYANAMEAERKLHQDRIEELEAKLATAMKFVKDFSYRAKTKEHNEDETWLVGESEIRFQRDCDITQARMIIAELETPHD